jgi:hypothetical protein
MAPPSRPRNCIHGTPYVSVHCWSTSFPLFSACGASLWFLLQRGACTIQRIALTYLSQPFRPPAAIYCSLRLSISAAMILSSRILVLSYSRPLVPSAFVQSALAPMPPQLDLLPTVFQTKCPCSALQYFHPNPHYSLPFSGPTRISNRI